MRRALATICDKLLMIARPLLETHKFEQTAGTWNVPELQVKEFKVVKTCQNIRKCKGYLDAILMQSISASWAGPKSTSAALREASVQEVATNKESIPQGVWKICSFFSWLSIFDWYDLVWFGYLWLVPRTTFDGTKATFKDSSL